MLTKSSIDRQLISSTGRNTENLFFLDRLCCFPLSVGPPPSRMSGLISGTIASNLGSPRDSFVASTTACWVYSKYINVTYLSKQRSTLSDMRRSMQSCSSAISCMSLSSPWPMFSHSRRVSGSTSAIWKTTRDHQAGWNSQGFIQI